MFEKDVRRVPVLSPDSLQPFLPVSNIDKTADWGYLRLRRVNYSEENLAEWLERVRAQNWDTTYVFFKHEDEGTGPKLAGQFLDLAKPVLGL